MLTTNELLKISRARLRDSEILFQSSRFDGAIYVCGYALEIRLKLRICKTLGWAGYPSTRGEFENLPSFKTHKLDILLKDFLDKFSSLERKLSGEHGSFSLFALFLREEPGDRWDLVLCAPWLRSSDIMN